MRNFIIVLLLTIISSLSISAQIQSQSIDMTHDINEYSPELSQKFENYKIVSLNAENILKDVRSFDNILNLTLEIDQNEKWGMKVFPQNDLVEDLKVYSATKGLISKPIEVYPYYGFLNNQNGSEIRITFGDDFIYGYVQDVSYNRFIEPLRHVISDAPKDLYIVYNGDDVIFPEGNFCASSHLQQKTKEFENNKSLSLVGECYEVEVATASDFSMFQNYNSNITDLTNHNVGVMNNVQGNYDDEFADEILFVLVEQWISDCSSCDPSSWPTGNDASALLAAFRSWAPGGFNETHDMGQLWTNRDIAFNGSSGTIGLAYVGVMCGPNRYQLLEDFNSNANLKRVMVAHETGHNFDAVSSSSTGHDPSGSAFIMAPSVSNVSDWSDASISDIESHYNSSSVNCLSTCAPPAPPIADFSVNESDICPGTTVQFFDESTEEPTTWNWTFTGGSPSSSSLQNPMVTYQNIGTYNVSLNVTNETGSDNTTMNGFITVSNNGTDILFMDDFTDDLSAWTVTNPDNDFGWEWDEVAGSSGSDGVAWLNNFDYNNGVGDLDGLETPVIDLSGRTGTMLDLEYAYSRYNSANSDVFRVRVSTNGGATFPNVVFTGQENGSGNFATVPDMDESFEPVSETDWCIATNFGPNCISIDLSVFDDQDNVVIRLENESDYGNNIFVDNVVITSSCQEIAPPTSIFTADIVTGCAPLTVQFQDLSVNGPTSWNWTFPGGNPSSSTLQNPVVTYETKGIFDVSLQTANGQGTDIETTEGFIEVFDIPTSSFTSNIDGNNAFFTNTSADATFYNWTFGDGASSTEENPIHVYDNDGVYTVTLVAGNICGTSTFMTDIEILSEPVANFTYSEVEGCLPFTVDFSNQSSANTDSYIWTFEGGTPATSTIANPSVVYEEAGTFDVSLTAINSQGENTQTIENLVVISDVPNVSFQAVEDDFTVNFTNQTINADSYLWDFGDDNTSIEANPSHIYSQDGEYTVILTASNACGSNSFEMVVNISSLPSAGFTTNNTEGCSVFTVQYENISSSNTESFFWEFEGGNPSSSTDENPIVNYTSPGIYDVSLTVTNSEGSDILQLQDYISVLDEPIANFNFSSTLQTVQFTDNSIYGTSYSWDFGDNTTSSLQNPSHNYEDDGEYVVTLTVTNACGSDEFVQTINIVSPVAGGFVTNISSGCAPLTVQYSDNSTSNVTDWQWSFPGGNPSSSNEANPIVTYSEKGVYSVTLLVSNEGFSDEIIMSDFISVNDVPQSGFIFDVNEQTVSFTNTSDDATSYTWSFGDGDTSNEINPDHVYDSEGIYEVMMIATNTCGTDTTVISINVSSLPTANFTSDFQIGCAIFTVDFIDLSTSNTTEWEWTFEGGSPSNSTMQNPKVQYTAGGTFDVTLIAKNELGEDTYVLEDYIVVSELPQVDIESSIDGNTVQFTAISDNTSTYEWNFEGYDEPFITENPEVFFSADGTYTVNLTATNDCGSMNFTTAVSITAYPDSEFSNSDIQCAPGEIEFTDLSTDDPNSWIWSFEGGNPTVSTEQNPTVSYEQSGTYDVQLIVSNAVGNDTIVKSNEIILEESPVAGFTFLTSENTVEFTNTSLGNGAVKWIFGNGDESNEENPTYTYPALGEYQVSLIIDNGANCQDTITQLVQILVINTIALDNDNIMVYPNPTNKEFVIEFDVLSSAIYNFKLVNSLGQIVSKRKIEVNSGRNIVQVESLFPSGLYYIHLQKEDQSIIRKMIIQH